MVMYSFQTFAFSQKSYMYNTVDLVEKCKYLTNTIISSFDIVSMYINIDVAVSEQLLENKINDNYHSIEVLAAGIDCQVLMTLVKLCNKYSMYFRFRNSF